jgi:hypothetical protein
MPADSTPFDPSATEQRVRAFWDTQGSGAAGRSLGPPNEPVVHQILTTGGPGEGPSQEWQRLYVADVQARHLASLGVATRAYLPWPNGRSRSTTFSERWERGLWTGREWSGEVPDRTERLQELIDRLAADRMLVVRDVPMRLCPTCQLPAAAETVVYNPEEGPAYLVRFPLRGAAPPVSILVWTDALWKLLGTSAVLLNPELRYVVAQYRRREVDERILVAKSSIDYLRTWLPGSSITTLEERPGSELVDQVYDHPLTMDYPALGQLSAPAGRLLPSPEIGESGTGLVALVPAHGGSDGPIAAGLGIPATSVLDPETARIFHGSAKYSDLPVEVADSVIVHDLIEGNHLFAELRVQRGVPHCAVCGSEIIWAPARAWCLEPGRMAEASVAQFSRRLPNDPLPVGLESVPWPVSEARPSEATSDPTLWECEECEELDSSPEPSSPSCDHDRTEVRRSLLPGFRESLETWIRIAPLDPNDTVHLFTAERRKVPTVLYHLVAMEAAEVRPENVGLSVLSTVPSVRGTEEHRIGESFDAYRAAVLRTSDRPANGWTLELTRVQEDRRLRKLWNLIGRLTDEMAAAGYRPEPDPVTVDVSALLPEDAAFLSVFEGVRSEVIKRLDGGRWSAAQELLAQFFEREFRAGYLALTRTRRHDPQWTKEKRSFYRTVMHMLERWLELFAPVAPFVSEDVARRLRPGAPSIFDRPRYPILQSLIRPDLDQQYRRWSSIARAIDRARRTARIPFSSIPRTFAVLSDTDEIANDLEKEGSVLVRMSRSPTIQHGSPSRPWPGRTLSSRFLLPEIRAAYPGMEQRIARTLAQLPAHRLQEGVTSGSLEIMLDGQPIPIRPNMLEFREAIPAGSCAAPWRSGEIVIEWDDPPIPDAGQRPLLSLGADRLVQGIVRSLRSRNGQEVPEEVVVWADPKLADEINRNALRLAEVLGVGRLRLVTSAEGFPSSQRRTGRSPEGPRWAYWIPSLRFTERRQKSRIRQRGPRRFEMPPVPNEGHDAETDRTEDERRSKEAAIRSMVDGIDAALGVPWVGPAKIGYAWEAGLRSTDEVLGAPYEQLAPIPGFGPWLADEVVRRRGTAPPHRATWTIAIDPGLAAGPGTSEGGPPADPAISGPSPKNIVEVVQMDLPSEPYLVDGGDPPPADVNEPPPPEPATAIASLDPLGHGTDRSDVPEPRSGEPPSDVLAPGPSGAGPGTIDPGPVTPGPAPQLTEGSVPDAQPGDAAGSSDPVLIGPVLSLPGPATLPITDLRRPSPDQIAGPRDRARSGHRAIPLPGDIGPEVPDGPVPAGPTVTTQGVLLVEGPAPLTAWHRFLDGTRDGHRGLCFTREAPSRMRAFAGPRDVEIFWISNLGQADSVSPADVEGFEAVIRRSLLERQVTGVYLEGIEYLIIVQSIERTLQLLRELDRLCRSVGAHAWIPVNPSLLRPEALDLLRTSFPSDT